MSEPPDNPMPFAYLDVRTPYGPGGLGLPADYARAALGAAGLACTDYGSVAGWPGWAAACRAAGVRPIFGLACDLVAESDDSWPLIALAATGAGLQNLIALHNRLTRTADGRCLLDVATLVERAAGLWLILVTAGEGGLTPLLTRSGPQAPAAVTRLRARLPHADALLCGLPADPATHAAVADWAATCALPLVALPAVRYPPTRHESRAYNPSTETQADDPQSAIRNPQGEPYGLPQSAMERAVAVAESCTATLADLALGGRNEGAAGAALDTAVAAALAVAGRGADRLLRAEVAALRGNGWAGSVVAAQRVVAVAAQLGLPLGAPGGVIAAGQVPALLGLCPLAPWPGPPRWLEAKPSDAAWTARLTVPGGRRAALVTALADTDAGLVAVRSGVSRGPAAALAWVIGPLAMPAATGAALEEALLEPRPAERSHRWRAALADLPAADADALLATTLAWAAAPGPPQADGEAVLLLPAQDAVPLLPATAGRGQIVAWTAAECAALGLPLLLLRGDPALDRWDQALALVGGAPPSLPTDDLRLVLTVGDLAGLPLPAESDTGLDLSPDGWAAFCATLLPSDPNDGLGWAALGALLYGPAGPHPWLRTYLRRHVGQAAVSYHYPALAAVLDSTSGLPLFCEQVTLLRLLINGDAAVPPAERMQLEEWLDQAERLAVGYTAALVAGERLHLALRLKATQPAALLAAGLESALIAGDAAELSALLGEARRHGHLLLPPAVNGSAVGFLLEAPPAAPPGEGSRRPAAAPPTAIRWGLAWSRAMQPWAATLVAARTQLPAGRFATFADLRAVAQAHGLPAAYVAGLIRSGACDRLGSRSALLAELLGVPIGDDAAPALPAEAATSASPVGDDSPARWRSWEAHLLGYAFTSPAGSDAILRPGGTRGVARLTLGGLGPAQVGQSVTVTVVPGAVRLVPPDGDDPLAVALVQDGDGAVPLVLFPPEYARFGALLVADTPVIVTARVQRAEGGAGQGAGVVLIGERLLPYAAPREEQELNMAVRKPRTVSEKPAKPVLDPHEYSASGQAYSRAPRPSYAPAGPGSDGSGEPPDPAFVRELPPAGPNAFPRRDNGSAPPAAPGQVVITLHPLANESDDEARMLQLKAILVRHPGPTGVMLFFPDDPLVGMPTHMPLKRMVTADESFCAEIDDLLGADCYELRAT